MQKPYTERDFYRQEFQSRTLLIIAPDLAGPTSVVLGPVLNLLADGGARAVVASPDADALEAIGVKPVLDPAHPRLPGEAWRALNAYPLLGLALPVGTQPLTADGATDPALREAVASAAERLGVFKLVWLSPEGALTTRATTADAATAGTAAATTPGIRQSFVHSAELRALLATPSATLAAPARQPLWREVARLLERGVPAVNVCSAEGLYAELFTYAGIGTLFTREHYIQVRRLVLDDYDMASFLLTRGVAEGYLAPRSTEQADAALANGFGAFVEGRHLAGVGALLRCGETRLGEVSCLYTLTRFLGEGVGEHLLDFAGKRARARGFEAAFGCTTHARVSAFFARQGFPRVAPDEIPEAKWRNYDPARRARLFCHLRKF